MSDSFSSAFGSSAAIMIMFVFFLIALIPAILFLLSLQKALQRCAPESRTASPGQVWLLLIPLFNIVWIFLLVGKISSSLRNEFLRRQIPLPEAEPGKTLGIAMAVLNLTSVIPLVGLVTGLAGFVCWILYWVKISGYSKQIAAPTMVQGAPYPA
jgi:hypothetical protein